MPLLVYYSYFFFFFRIPFASSFLYPCHAGHQLPWNAEFIILKKVLSGCFLAQIQKGQIWQTRPNILCITFIFLSPILRLIFLDVVCIKSLFLKRITFAGITIGRIDNTRPIIFQFIHSWTIMQKIGAVITMINRVHQDHFSAFL